MSQCLRTHRSKWLLMSSGESHGTHRIQRVRVCVCVLSKLAGLFYLRRGSDAHDVTVPLKYHQATEQKEKKKNKKEQKEQRAALKHHWNIHEALT